ncbi:hypothetical protein [Pseudoruegeria sp. HB172150]|uniref:hypothetical protein n=1 Tax=Pseudoruegeria sp. HB172150 TaxID=2721164 RepID=UPI0015545D63|nr:hypothetical protein [Pseudoruegeria sp. HB172150]
MLRLSSAFLAGLATAGLLPLLAAHAQEEEPDIFQLIEDNCIVRTRVNVRVQVQIPSGTFSSSYGVGSGDGSGEGTIICTPPE